MADIGRLVAELKMVDSSGPVIDSITRKLSALESKFSRTGNQFDRYAEQLQENQLRSVNQRIDRLKAIPPNQITPRNLSDYQSLTAEFDYLTKTLSRNASIDIDTKPASQKINLLQNEIRKLSSIPKSAITPVQIQSLEKAKSELSNLKSSLRGLSEGDVLGRLFSNTQAIYSMSDALRTVGINVGPLRHGLAAFANEMSPLQIEMLGFASATLVAGVEVAKFINKGIDFNRFVGGFEFLAQRAKMVPETLLSSLQVASRGIISNYDLIGSANKAMLLKVSANEEQMGRLLEQAVARGRIMGISAAESFDRIATGIGRLSPRILDDLGIVTGGIATYTDYAKSIGKVYADLTEADKRAALVNRVIKEQIPIVDDARDEWDRLTVSIENYINAQARRVAQDAGKIIVPGTTSNVSGFINQQTAATEAQIRFSQALSKAGIYDMFQFQNMQVGPNQIPFSEKDIRSIFPKATDEDLRKLSVAKTLFFALNQSVETLNKTGNLENFNKQFSKLIQLLENLGKKQPDFKSLSDSVRSAGTLSNSLIINEPEIQDKLTKIQEQINADAIAIGTKLGKAAKDSYLSQQTKAFEELQRQLVITNPSLSDAALAIAILGDNAQKNKDYVLNFKTVLEQLGDAAKDTYTKAISAAQSSLNALIPKVGVDRALTAVDEQVNRVNKTMQLGSLFGWTKTVDGTKQLTRELLKAGDANDRFVDGLTKTNTSLSTTQKTVDALANSIENLIDQSISSTTGLVDFKTFGLPEGQNPHGFDPNGPAQNFGRMWDVAVNGMQSQWWGVLRDKGLIPQDVIDQGEGALKAFADRSARAFQKGTDLSMLDKDALKQQVIEQAIRDKNIQDLRAQILAELTNDKDVSKKYGVSKKQLERSANKVIAPDALGISADSSDFEGLGKSVATGIKTGFEDEIKNQNISEKLYVAWHDNLLSDKSLVKFAEIGTSLGESVSGAFVSAMRKGVGNLRQEMAKLIAPEVARELRARDAGRAPLDATA